MTPPKPNAHLSPSNIETFSSLNADLLDVRLSSLQIPKRHPTTPICTGKRQSPASPTIEDHLVNSIIVGFQKERAVLILTPTEQRRRIARNPYPRSVVRQAQILDATLSLLLDYLDWID